MNQPKKGLGKGLDALIPKGSVFTSGRTVVSIDITKVSPNPKQPRTTFDEKELLELSESIKDTGVIQPILCRMSKTGYELVAGERRLRASKLAGSTTIPAIIKDFSDEESVQIALIENLQRVDLNPVDEADAYNRLSLEFNWSQEQIAKKVGRNRSTIANMMRLLDLPGEILDGLRNSKISAGHARALLAAPKEKQLELYHYIIKNNLNVRDIETFLSSTHSKKQKRKIHRKTLDIFKDVVDNLMFSLGTKVRIYGTMEKGKIEIDYFSKEDLDRLIDLLTKKEA
ncbi:MAG: ParB/RepB/Spo0J family partition protein [Candidatus Saganbacteria bacterium]|nr:ParB/RepB/Spo0J family partition protein [Candidatus Saganbacteria bacterium]